MSSKKNYTGTFILRTYSDTVQIGSDSSSTATVQTTAANSAPTFSGFNYEDANAISAGVTGNNQIMIQGISSLKVTAQAAAAKNGATISSYSAVAGSKTASSTTTSIPVGTITETGTIPVVVTVIDSRGYTTSVTVNITVLEYSSVSIKDYSMRRVNEVEDVTQVSISGELSPITIDNINNNSLQHLYYRYKKTSEESYNDWADLINSVSHNDNSFSFVLNEWLNLDADYSYYVQFYAADKLTSDTVTITIAQGTPLLSFRRKKIGVNKREPIADLDVAGNIMMNGQNVQGYIRTLARGEGFDEITESGIYYGVDVPGVLEVIAIPDVFILQRYTTTDLYRLTRVKTPENGWGRWVSENLNN